jgi:L-aminopeptidase/D-esterase-like protein
VVNAVGAIHDREGRVVRGNLDPSSGRRLPALEALAVAGAQTPRAGENTTLTLLVTNQRLTGRELSQLGKQVHASMARAIQPFHSVSDGDTLFALTTNEVQEAGLQNVAHLGAIAAELAWDAVLTCWDP